MSGFNLLTANICARRSSHSLAPQTPLPAEPKPRAGHGNMSRRWGGGDQNKHPTSRWDPAAEMQNKSGTALVGKQLHCGESRLGSKRRKRKYFGNNPREGQSWRWHFIKARLRPHPNPSQQNKRFLQLRLAQHIFKIHISCHRSCGTLSSPPPLYFLSFFRFLIGPMMPYLYSRSELPCAPGNFPPVIKVWPHPGGIGWGTLDSGGRTQPAG